MLPPPQSVWYALLLCVLGAILVRFRSRGEAFASRTALTLILLSSVLAGTGALRVLLQGPALPITYLSWPGIGTSLRLHVDGLSAVFVGLIAVIAVATTVYSVGYLRGAHVEPSGWGRYYGNLLLFVGGMYGLVCVTDLWLFFGLFWQMMTLSSYALIRFDGRPDQIRAANRYLWMMQLALVAILLGTIMLAGGPWTTPDGERLPWGDFDALSHHLAGRLENHSILSALAFGLFFIGFGIKVGMWPFGPLWLPQAHPAAPSPISALLSGVMIKTGVYGLMRTFLWLVPASSAAQFPGRFWGGLLATLGVLTLFLGSWQALKQEESKRLLAFSSIGQVGYILFGLGACLLLLSRNDPLFQGLAAVAFVGILFHLINHGLFKSLLFLSAGSLLHATGTQKLGQMGGLMGRMPWTAVTTLIGCLCIAGVPLSNGFASKWTIYTATLRGASALPWLAVGAFVAIGTSAITLVIFLKYFGAAFLSRSTRKIQEQTATSGSLEVNPWMRLPMVALATACVTLGLLPSLGLGLSRAAVTQSAHGWASQIAAPLSAAGLPSPGIEALADASRYVPLLLFVMLFALFLLGRWISHLAGSTRRPAASWLCGYARDTDQVRYTAKHLCLELPRSNRRPSRLRPDELPATDS